MASSLRCVARFRQHMVGPSEETSELCGCTERHRGLTQTYGTFQEYYEGIHLSDRSSSDISWIGSMQSFLVVIVGVIAGPLFDMGWLKPCLFIGCFLVVFGMVRVTCRIFDQWVLTGFSTDDALIVQGVLAGVSSTRSRGGLWWWNALHTCHCTGHDTVYDQKADRCRPSIVRVQYWYVTIATVLTKWLTSRPGGIIYPIMFRNIQPSAGFGWAVRAIGFVILGTLCGALLILGRHKQPKPTNRRRFKTLFAFSALKEPRFLAFTASLFFIFLGFYIPLFYVPLYAQYSLKTTEDLAYNLVAVVNAGSFLGRILPFLVKGLPPVYNLTFWTAASAILLFCWIAIHNIAGFIVWTVLYGFASGVIISASPSVVAHKTLCPDLANVGSRLGLSWAFAALGILIVSVASRSSYINQSH